MYYWTSAIYISPGTGKKVTQNLYYQLPSPVVTLTEIGMITEITNP